jgi:hypothetical protein
MNKHKRKKRYDRDFFIYQKYHVKKKAKVCFSSDLYYTLFDL